MEEKNDWCAHSKPKKAKKVYRFLQYGIKKNDWYAHCKKNNKKIKKYIDSYVHIVKKKKKIQSTNHLNSSSHLILILCMEYIHIFIISFLRDFFCLFIL